MFEKEAKELLERWVWLFKPKFEGTLPFPLQKETEQFLKENEE